MENIDAYWVGLIVGWISLGVIILIGHLIMKCTNSQDILD